MSRWIDVGSTEYCYGINRAKMQAYLTWIGVDLATINVENAFTVYPNSKWDTIYKHWATTAISTQSQAGLDIMRETYTKKTGSDWKMATLDSVYKTLGWCHELYQNGLILMSGKLVKRVDNNTPKWYAKKDVQAEKKKATARAAQVRESIRTDALETRLSVMWKDLLPYIGKTADSLGLVRPVSHTSPVSSRRKILDNTTESSLHL